MHMGIGGRSVSIPVFTSPFTPTHGQQPISSKPQAIQLAFLEMDYSHCMGNDYLYSISTPTYITVQHECGHAYYIWI